MQTFIRADAGLLALLTRPVAATDVLVSFPLTFPCRSTSGTSPGTRRPQATGGLSDLTVSYSACAPPCAGGARDLVTVQGTGQLLDQCSLRRRPRPDCR
jgi:hypothetical protein